MVDFAYVLVPNRISVLLDQIRKVNRPSKVTQDWFKGIGLTSSADRGLIQLLKALGYIDGGGVPTDQGAALKGAEQDRRASIGRQMHVATRREPALPTPG